MLRLSNATETLTTLTLAGHKKLIGLLERYLGWRGCKEDKCLLLIGASGQQSTVANALSHAMRIARRQKPFRAPLLHVTRGALNRRGWRRC